MAHFILFTFLVILASSMGWARVARASECYAPEVAVGHVAVCITPSHANRKPRQTVRKQSSRRPPAFGLRRTVVEWKDEVAKIGHRSGFLLNNAGFNTNHEILEFQKIIRQLFL